MSVQSMQPPSNSPFEHMQALQERISSLNNSASSPPTSPYKKETNMLLAEQSSSETLAENSQEMDISIPQDSTSKTDEISNEDENGPQSERFDDSSLPSLESYQGQDSIRSGSLASPTGEISLSPSEEQLKEAEDAAQKFFEEKQQSDWKDEMSMRVDEEGRETYYCHLCSYSGNSKFLFNSHMNSHFEHRCEHCDYTSRTEGRLKRHIKDFHSQIPPPNYSGQSKVVRNGSMGRPKIYRCKQCDFASPTKEDFWEHSRSHIKEDKILQCPKCPFVTEYKHHLEYHLRNHFGSKPFKCTKCNYSCVNKSMLNSHMKSHTNVYQFRCSDCTYATKYCHSLKLHLRKYNHKPANVLNLDGTVDESYDATSLLSPKRGPPRGPRGPRRDKNEPSPPPTTSVPGMIPLPQLAPRPALNGMIPSPYWPMQNGVHIPPPPLIPVSSGLTALHAQLMQQSQAGQTYSCNVCDFKAEQNDELNRHVLSVHARENQDLFSMFGISSEALVEDHLKREQLMGQHSEESNALNVRTENSESPQSQGPPSWPVRRESNSTSPPQSTRSLPDIYEENRLVIDLGRSGKKESPLDLTKPKTAGCLGDSEEDSQSAPQQSRKSKRKGRAFKLDQLCLRLQEKCDNSGELMDDDDDEEIMTTSTPIMNKQDENHNCSTNCREIHEHGNITDSEKYIKQSTKVPLTPQQQQMMLAEQQKHFQNTLGLYAMNQLANGHPSINGIAVANKAAGDGARRKENYECHHCDIAFRDCIMYTMHMGYHGYHNPFKCNMCGHESKDKVAFFLHIARAAHA